MSKKLVTALNATIGAVGTIACAWVTFAQPANATAIVAAIGIAVTAAEAIINQFVKTETKAAM
jgi:hypothetical protein